MKKVLVLILAFLMIVCSFASCDEGIFIMSDVTDDAQECESNSQDETLKNNGSENTDVCVHVDFNENHLCDECNKKITYCLDQTKNHTCDICDVKLSYCADANKNHLCDICTSKLNDCRDEDKNHICDYCFAILDDCVDSDTNYKCDYCGKSAYERNADTITFGSYPQTKISDTHLINKLNSLSGKLPTSVDNKAWTSYGYYVVGQVENYMWYIDIEERGEKYRGVYFTSYRPSLTTNDFPNDNKVYWNNQYKNGYRTSMVYWFRYEPISWTVVSKDKTNGTAIVLCDMIMDSHEFYIDKNDRVVGGDTFYSNNYEHSTIRKWLNDTFYNTAFGEFESQIILSTMVDNSRISTGVSQNRYFCENTEDKIFLLSTVEIMEIDTNLGKSVLRKKPTDYAKAQGTSSDISVNHSGEGSWLLRSPDESCSYSLCSIDSEGSYIGYRTVVDAATAGVVPVLQIKL